MDDLISRKAALEALGECPENWEDSPEEIEAVNSWLRAAEVINSAPSVSAVPLDKLCEWLGDIAGGKNNTLCVECCGSEGAECPDKNCLCENPDAWKRHLIKWMEGLDGTD